MLVLKPTSPSRHPENGEGATFIKNNDTAFITRPSLSFDGKRREMGRETTEGREKRGKNREVIVPRIFGLRAFEQLGLSRRSSES